MRDIYGFKIRWKQGKKEHCFLSESMTETEHKSAELRAKGYRVSHAENVIFTEDRRGEHIDD